METVKAAMNSLGGKEYPEEEDEEEDNSPLNKKNDIHLVSQIFLRHLVNVGCFVVVVVVVIDTIVCLVRKVAFFCLKLVKEFVLNSRVSAL